MTNSNTTTYNRKSLFKGTLKLALPMALHSVLASSVQLVDNLYIGRMETAQNVANAMNAVNNITFILSTLITGFIAGIGVYFAQASGSENKNEQKTFFKIKIIWAILLSISFLTTAFIFLKPIASLWITNANAQEKHEILNEVFNYGAIIIPTLLIDYLVICFSSSFKENKKNWITLSISISALVFNASLNYPFIYVLGLGVKGSAITTLMARVVELSLWIFYLQKKKPDFLPNLKEIFAIKFKKIFIVFKKAAWWSFNGFLGTLAFTLQIMFLSKVSTDAGASLNSAGVVAQLIYAFSGGYASAITILIMHKIGRGETHDIKWYTKTVSLQAFFVGITLGVTLSAIAPAMLIIYPNYSYYSHIQSMIMLWAISCMIPINLYLTAYFTVIKGYGYTKMLIIIDSLLAWVITVPLTILLTAPYLYDQVNIVTLDYGIIYLLIAFTGMLKIPIVLTFFWKKIGETIPIKLF